MALSFPNECRSFDHVRKRVRFWAYNQSIEISLFVEEDALQKLSETPCTDASEILASFDAARDLIHAVADKVYARSARGTYAISLHASDF